MHMKSSSHPTPLIISIPQVIGILFAGTLVLLGVCYFWGSYRFNKGQQSIYDGYSHGQVIAYKDTNEVFLTGQNGLPNIQLSFGLFKKPVIEDSKVISFEDTDEVDLPKSIAVGSAERKLGRPFIPPDPADVRLGKEK